MIYFRVRLYEYMVTPFFAKAVLILGCIWPISCQAQTWTPQPEFPGVERDDGTSFVVGSTAYCGTGITAGFGTWADFYAFDMDAGTWSNIASLPTSEIRQYAVGFSGGAYGYVFGGTDAGIFFNDLWRYEPELDSWTPMTPMPAEGRSGAMCFVIGEDAYIMGGKTPELQALDEVWVYHMDADSWEQKAPMPFGSRWRASAAAIEGLGYLIFGRDAELADYNTAYRYDPTLDEWTALEPFPGVGRIYVAMQVVGNHLMAFSGSDLSSNIYADLWRFDVTTQTWTALTPLPAPARRGGMSFTDGSNFYYTTGLNADFERLKETWKASGLTNVEDMYGGTGMALYPNPCEDVCYLKMKEIQPSAHVDLRVCDARGRTWIEYSGTYSDEMQIDISNLDCGLYIIQLIHEKGAYNGRLVKY